MTFASRIYGWCTGLPGNSGRVVHPPAAVLAVPLLLAACGPLISFGSDNAQTVYSLQYDGLGVAPPGAPVVYVDDPLTADGLGGREVAVRLGTYERTTLDGVLWSSSATDLVRDYLVQSLADDAQVQTLGQGGLDVAAGCRLGLKIWQMHFVPGETADADEVVMSIDAILVNITTSELAGRRMFNVESPVPDGSGERVMIAFNVSMSLIAKQMSRWLAERRDICSR